MTDAPGAAAGWLGLGVVAVGHCAPGVAEIIPGGWLSWTARWKFRAPRERSAPRFRPAWG